MTTAVRIASLPILQIPTASNPKKQNSKYPNNHPFTYPVCRLAIAKPKYIQLTIATNQRVLCRSAFGNSCMLNPCFHPDLVSLIAALGGKG